MPSALLWFLDRVDELRLGIWFFEWDDFRCRATDVLQPVRVHRDRPQLCRIPAGYPELHRSSRITSVAREPEPVFPRLHIAKMELSTIVGLRFGNCDVRMVDTQHRNFRAQIDAATLKGSVEASNSSRDAYISLPFCIKDAPVAVWNKPDLKKHARSAVYQSPHKIPSWRIERNRHGPRAELARPDILDVGDPKVLKVGGFEHVSRIREILKFEFPFSIRNSLAYSVLRGERQSDPGDWMAAFCLHCHGQRWLRLGKRARGGKKC